METKSFLTSKTLWGLVIAMLPSVLAKFNLHVADVAGFTDAANAAVDAGIQLAGAAAVVWGRFTATKALVIKS